MTMRDENLSNAKSDVSLGDHNLCATDRAREVALPNRQGHTCAPWAASGRGQQGCWAEFHHHGV